jgi:hypothetical protein
MSELPPSRIIDCTPDEYHKLPGFSASLAKIVIRQSAAHAKDAADRQAERFAAEDEPDDEDMPADRRKRLDGGSIDHALILGIGKRIEVIPADMLATNGAISTKAAKAFVEEHRRAGRIPIKEADLEVHERIADAVRARIAAAGHILDGRSELAIEWWEPTSHGPVMCRCMMDHVVMWDAELPFSGAAPGALIYELKMVGDAHPERCQRTAENLGYAIAAAAYPRALAALYPRLAGRTSLQFLFCETKRPYAIWDPPRCSGAFREIGERRWLRAVRAWAELQATGKAPSYREQGYDEITAPMWTLKQEGYQPTEF